MNVLSSLKDLYEDLNKRGKLPTFGWSPVKISYILDIDQDGALNSAGCIMEQKVTPNGKTILRPQVFELPAAVTRSSGYASNFLWDNSSYVLGVDAKNKPDRAERCFQEFRKFHHALLDEVKTPMAMALLRFLDLWDPADFDENPRLDSVKEGIISGSNITFTVNGELLTDDISIKDAWYKHFSDDDGPLAQCLVTGEWTKISLTHPLIKKLDGAQPSGAKLVSFNEDAFCSIGFKQGENAPTSKYAAFAYTSALNYLLDERRYIQTTMLGKTTVLFWVLGASDEEEEELYKLLRQLMNGTLVKDIGERHLNTEVYLLGLAPNAARISVRFAEHKRLSDILHNVQAHHERMAIVRPSFDQNEEVPLWMIYNDIVRQKAELPEQSKAAIFKAVLTGSRYPYTMPENALARIRAERRVTRTRAAILKAYYLQSPNPDCPEEVLTVSLNESSKNIPYNLGRLFSLYEAIQEAAIPNINSTIKDRYFKSASFAPSSVFPALTSLCTNHLRKLERKETGLYYFFVKQVEDILALLPEEFPVSLNVAEQGSFCLGYYHQTQKRYSKKENTEI